MRHPSFGLVLLTFTLCAASAGCGDGGELFGGGGGLFDESTREAPCEQVRALYFEGESGWLGCSGSVGGGIYRTTNGGRSWSHAADTEGAPMSLRGQSARFNDIEAGDDGSIYFCGGDNNASPKVFLYRLTPGGQWEVVMDRDILLAGGGRGYSDCQNVAIDGDFILTDDNAGSQIAWSEDGGQSWSKADVGQISELTLIDGVPYGGGGTTGDGPRFYADSGDEATLMAGELITGDSGGAQQEARGLATPDDGTTWLLAGATDGQGGAYIWRSTDGGQSWQDTGVTGSDVSFFEDLACIDSWCIAAGRSYPEDEGLAYESTDGGASWTRRSIDTGLSPFYTAYASEETIWLAGDGPDLLRLAR